MDNVDLAYCAGFFDGEGSVLIREKRKGDRVHHGVQASIQQNDPYVLAFFRDVVNVGNVTSYVGASGNRIWRWQTSGKDAGLAMELLLPHLKLKKEEARIAIEFAASIGNVGTYQTSEVLMMRRNLYTKYKHTIEQRRLISHG